MKKFLISLFLGALLSGCSSPPKPPSLQNKSYTSIYDNDFMQPHKNKVSANFEVKKASQNKSITYTIIGINKNQPIVESDKIKVFFLAAHADDIRIIGSEENINFYINYFQNKTIESNFIKETTFNNDNTVTFIFTSEVITNGFKSK